MLSKKSEAKLNRARKINRGRDALDRKSGAAAPGDCPLEAHLRTILEALKVGFDAQNWDCVAEGIAMLEDAEVRARG